MNLKILPKLWLIFCYHQQKIQRYSHFRHSNNHNSGEQNKINRQMTSFFPSVLWALPLVCFISAFEDSIGSPTCIMFWSVKYTLTYMPKMILSSLLIYISFFYVKFSNSWYITCFVPNLIPIWPQSRGL